MVATRTKLTTTTGLKDRLDTLERQVAQLEADLAHAQRLAALGTAAGMIAHEINNILTPMLSYSHSALSSPGDQELLIKAAQRAVEASERAAKISTAVLGFAKVADQNDLAEVDPAIDGALACLGRDPMRDGISVVRDVPRGARARIQPVVLQHVFLNLLLNARRALLATHGGRLSIDVQDWDGSIPPDAVSPAPPMPLRQDQCHWRINVHDSGGGISPNRISSIFRDHASDSAGSGLGLTFCKQALHQVGGTIWFQTALAHGTTFSFTLPKA